MYDGKLQHMHDEKNYENCTMTNYGTCTATKYNTCAMTNYDKCTMTTYNTYTMTYYGKCTMTNYDKCTMTNYDKCTMTNYAHAAKWASLSIRQFNIARSFEKNKYGEYGELPPLRPYLNRRIGTSPYNPGLDVRCFQFLVTTC